MSLIWLSYSHCNDCGNSWPNQPHKDNRICPHCGELRTFVAEQLSMEKDVA